jgi:hypothetical protein
MRKAALKRRAALAAELHDQKAEEGEEESDKVEVEPGHSWVRGEC